MLPMHLSCGLLATAFTFFSTGFVFAKEEGPWRTPAFFLTAVPKAGAVPEIDGRVNPEEWQDAMEWSFFFNPDLKVLVSNEVKTSLWMKWDAEYFYVAMRGVLYPEGSAVRGTERVRQATAGIQNADHMIFELYPLADRSAATASRVGSFSWVWNPLATLSDFHVNARPGHTGESFTSDAVVSTHNEPGSWEAEIKIPLHRLQNENMANALVLPPKAGQTFGFHAHRRYGYDADTLNAATALRAPVFMVSPEAGASSWQELPAARLTENAPVLRVATLGDLGRGEFQPLWEIFNPSPESRTVDFEAVLLDTQGKEVFKKSGSITAPPNATTPGPVWQEKLQLPKQGLSNEDVKTPKLFLKIREKDGEFLFIGPGMPVMVFDDELHQQIKRALESLRS